MVDLHVIRHGTEHPVRFVLVHGLSSNARMWDGVGEELARRGHGSIAVDLRGHGLSPKPDDGYDFDSVVGDLVPILAELDRPVVAGQSYGGNVVVVLAARQPQLVGSIVCVDGGAIDLGGRGTLDECLELMKPPYHLFEGRTWDEHAELVRRMNADWPEAGIEGQLACMEVGPDGRVRARLTWPRHRQIIEAMWNEPPTDLFADIDVPVLFLVASERMRGAVERAVKALADGRAVFLDGAAHDVHAQRPVEVAEHLVSMLG